MTVVIRSKYTNQRQLEHTSSSTENRPFMHISLEVQSTSEGGDTNRVYPSATLVLEQLSPRLSEETCEERYVEARKIEACLRRATGEAFDVFEEPPARNGGDDESESESEGESESARGGDDAAKEEL